MKNVIDLLCRLLPNDVKVTVPKISRDTLYTVTGMANINTEYAIVIAKKDNSDATFHIPCNLIDKIIIIDCNKDEKDKS